MVGAIANEANVPAKFIGAIDISERFSLVEVDSAQADKIVNTMQRVRFKGRPATVKFDGTREERSDRLTATVAISKTVNIAERVLSASSTVNLVLTIVVRVVNQEIYEDSYAKHV